MTRVSVLGISALMFVVGRASGQQPTPAPGASEVVTRRLLERIPGGAGRVSASPDGRSLAIMSLETGTPAILDIATGKTTPIITTDRPWESGFTDQVRLSRDGQRVAFNWYDETKQRYVLRTAKIDGSEVRTVFDRPASPYVWAEDWSPDGKSILAWANDEARVVQIMLIPSDGSAPRTLKTLDWRSPGRMSFSPDGRYVAYSHQPNADSDRSNLYIIDLVSSRETHIAAGSADDDLLGWSPDANRILFASDRGGTPGAWWLPVANGKAAGEPVVVKRDLWRATPIGFAPQSNSFLYAVSTGGRYAQLATFDQVTGKLVGAPIPLPHDAMASSSPAEAAVGPKLAPDGRSVAFVTAVLGTKTLAIQSVETGQSREFPLPQFGTTHDLNWLPDGSALLILAWQRGHLGIHRVDVRTGNASTVLAFPAKHAGYGFAVAANGSFVAFAADSHNVSRIFVQDARTGEVRTVATARDGNGFGNFVAISPDGSRIALLRKDEKTKTDELQTMPIAGGVATTIATLAAPASPKIGGPMVWSPDGQWILFRHASGDGPSTLWRVSARGGVPEVVGVGQTGVSASLSADGKRLTFAAGQRRDELWVMQNLSSTAKPSAVSKGKRR